jgi:hypothetical protein
MTLPLSALMAVKMRRFYKLLLFEKPELCKTILSSRPISSFGNSASMKALTVVETSSALLLSGKAVETI